MARINIEDCWWVDPRRSKLVRLLGDEGLADGTAVRMWRIAQEFWGKSRGLIPNKIWNTLEHCSNLLEAGLAEEREGGIYVCGSSQYLDWVIDQKERARAAGKKSAESRKLKHGTAQPKPNLPNEPRTEPEQTPNEPRTESNDIEPSDSGSGSDSNSDSKKNIKAPAYQVRPPPEPMRNDWTLEEVKLGIPIITQEQWAHRYPDRGWLDEAIEQAFIFHTSDPSAIPRTRGQWNKKLHTWLSNGWPTRKKAAGAENYDWDKVFAKPGGER